MSWSVCRICLAGNKKMYSIANTQLLDIYQTLTSDQWERDRRPDTVCYICYHLLTKCFELQEMSQLSEKIFAQFFAGGFEFTADTVPILNERELHHLSVTSVQEFTVGIRNVEFTDTADVKVEDQAEIKEENPTENKETEIKDIIQHTQIKDTNINSVQEESAENVSVNNTDHKDIINHSANLKENHMAQKIDIPENNSDTNTTKSAILYDVIACSPKRKRKSIGENIEPYSLRNKKQLSPKDIIDKDTNHSGNKTDKLKAQKLNATNNCISNDTVKHNLPTIEKRTALRSYKENKMDSNENIEPHSPKNKKQLSLKRVTDKDTLNHSGNETDKVKGRKLNVTQNNCISNVKHPPTVEKKSLCSYKEKKIDSNENIEPHSPKNKKQLSPKHVTDKDTLNHSGNETDKVKGRKLNVTQNNCISNVKHPPTVEKKSLCSYKENKMDSNENNEPHSPKKRKLMTPNRNTDNKNEIRDATNGIKLEHNTQAEINRSTICLTLRFDLSDKNKFTPIKNHSPKYNCNYAEDDKNINGEYVCKYCEKTYKVRYGLANHLKTHEENLYKCEYCSKTFCWKSVLKLHKETHKTFGDENTKRITRHNHRDLNQKIDRLYSCEICEKSFCQLSHLQHHMRTHTGENPYACEICGKRFKQLSNLSQHFRVHTGSKPYVCPFCRKSFRQVSNLEQHKKKYHVDNI